MTSERRALRCCWSPDQTTAILGNQQQHQVVPVEIRIYSYNPCQPKWCLALYPSEYVYSSVKFYETVENTFGLPTHYNNIQF
jgi:hypothetical protein